MIKPLEDNRFGLSTIIEDDGHMAEQQAYLEREFALRLWRDALCDAGGILTIQVKRHIYPEPHWLGRFGGRDTHRVEIEAIINRVETRPVTVEVPIVREVALAEMVWAHNFRARLKTAWKILRTGRLF